MNADPLIKRRAPSPSFETREPSFVGSVGGFIAERRLLYQEPIEFLAAGHSHSLIAQAPVVSFAKFFSHPTLMKTLRSPIARNLLWLVLGDGFVKGAMVLITAMIARSLGASSVGVFSIAIGAVLVAIPLFSLGQVQVLIRDTAATPESATELVDAAHRIQIRGLAILLPLGVLTALLLPDAELKWTILAFALYPVLRMRTVTIGAAFKGLDRMDVEVKARFLEMGLVLVMVAIIAASDRPVWATGVAFCLGAAASLGWLNRQRHHLPRGGATVRSLDLFRSGLPFVGIAVGSQLLFRSDLFLAAAFAIPKERIGLYGASATLVWGLLALPQVTALAIYPTFSRLSAAHRSSFSSALVAAALGGGVGTAAALLFWTLRDPILVLFFGPQFQGAAELLGRLAWALPGACASMVLGVVIAAWHRQKWGFVFLSVSLALALVLNVIWIPRAGLLAAATVAVAVHSFAALGNFALAAWPQRERSAVADG